MGTKTELQAVIMAAGKGSRMMELTAHKPKCLLPIGNFPMIWFPINLLQNSGFQEVIIVVLETNKSEIQAALDKFALKLKIDIVSIPIGEDWGTADSLRFLEESNKIKSDVLVLSSDLVTDISLNPLFELYRRHNAAITALFAPANLTPFPTPGPKSKNKTERDFVAIDESTSRLVFIASASDFEEELPLPSRLVKKFGKITLNSNLLDTHVYILSRTLCKYLVCAKNLGTLKGELLPHVVKKQSQTNSRKIEDKATSIIGVDVKTDLLQMNEESNLVLKARNMSTYTDNRLEAVYKSDNLRCYAHIAEGNIALRTNSLAEYTRANRLIIEKWSELTGLEVNRISPSATIQSTQLETDTCLVGEKVNIAEKTSIKSSILATSVTIAPKTRVGGSVLMASAKIGVGCNIQNCIVCEEAIVSDGCDLKDCLIGSHFTVPPGGKHGNEVLATDRLMMEI